MLIINNLSKSAVRDHLPLKQGLRLFIDVVERIVTTGVRDHLPLKQGLRHAY